MSRRKDNAGEEALIAFIFSMIVLLFMGVFSVIGWLLGKALDDSPEAKRKRLSKGKRTPKPSKAPTTQSSVPHPIASNSAMADDWDLRGLLGIVSFLCFCFALLFAMIVFAENQADMRRYAELGEAQDLWQYLQAQPDQMTWLAIAGALAVAGVLALLVRPAPVPKEIREAERAARVHQRQEAQRQRLETLQRQAADQEQAQLNLVRDHLRAVQQEGIVVTIRTLRVTKWSANDSYQLVNHIVSSLPGIALQIVADERQIEWRLLDFDTQRMPQSIVDMLRSLCPDADISCERLTLPTFEQPIYRRTEFYELADQYPNPILRIQDTKQGDPMRGLIGAFNSLQAGERVILSFGILGVARGAGHKAQQMITQSAVSTFDAALAYGGYYKGYVPVGKRVPKYVPRDQKVLEDKIREVMFHTSLAIQMDAPSFDRLMHLVQLVNNQVLQYVNMPYNALVPTTDRPYEAHNSLLADELMCQFNDIALVHYRWLKPAKGDIVPPLVILTSSEIAPFWHLPHEEVTASRVA